jgi:hypothetical protein
MSKSSIDVEVVEERQMARQWAGLTVIAGLIGSTCFGCAQAPTAADASFNSTAIRLDKARRSIQPSLGANMYEFTQPFIENVPQGENASLNQVLVRAPNAPATRW